MSEATSTTGVLVKRAAIASPLAFVTVAEITNVSGIGKSRNEKETSTHNDGVESHITGILRQKSPSFKVNLVGADPSHSQINTDIDDDIKAIWQFAYPSGTTVTGPGRVKQFDLDDAPMDGVWAATIAISWAGQAVWVLA